MARAAGHGKGQGATTTPRSVATFENGVMSVLFDTALNFSSFGEDEDGELYVVNLAGTVHKLVPGPRKRH
jgi:hypothetical protein